MSGAVAGGTGAVVVQLVEEYWETDVLVVQTTEALGSSGGGGGSDSRSADEHLLCNGR